MTRMRAGLGLALVLTLSVGASAAHGGGSRPVSAAPLGPGVVHEVWAVDGSTARVHVARVEAGSPARLRVVPAAGGMAGRETTGAICRRTPGCRVALNGDFFTPDGPVGGVVVEGRMLRSPRPDHEQLSLEPLRATTRGLGPDGWSGVVQPLEGEPLALDGVNVALAAGAVVLYTPAYGAASPACGCAEVVLARDGEEPFGTLGRPVAARVSGRGSGRTPLPPGTAVLAAEGPAADRLLALVAGDGRLTVILSVAQPTQQNLGAHPVLLRDGQRAPVDTDDPMLADPHPRSVVGWNGAGTTWLLAFDGRRRGGPGPRAEQVVDVLLRLGVTDAVLLDGGGSTAMATPERVLNAPSDGRERPVANALVVSWVPPAGAAPARPAAPPPPPPAPPVEAVAVAPAVVVPAPAAAPLPLPGAEPAAPGAVTGEPSQPPVEPLPVAPVAAEARGSEVDQSEPEVAAAPALSGQPELAQGRGPARPPSAPAPSGTPSAGLLLTASGLAAAATAAWAALAWLTAVGVVPVRRRRVC